MKNFALVMGLLFGSAGAHTYLKSGQIAPPLAKALLNERLHIQHHKCNSNNAYSKSLQLMQ